MAYTAEFSISFAAGSLGVCIDRLYSHCCAKLYSRTGREKISKILMPMKNEAAVLPRHWFQGSDIKDWRFIVKILGADKNPIGAPIELKAGPR